MGHLFRPWFLLVCVSTACLAQIPAARGTAKSDAYVGNEACARCHASIFESYAKTFMARASGPAIDNLNPADFVHNKSGVHYRIYAEGGKVWLSFERPGDPALHGKRELLYYIGSGRRGQSYLFATDGFLFESPVNWYADKRMWDTAPAYQNATEIPLNLPALPSCLHCHVSGMQPPLKGTENWYPMPVFASSGVSCERCHGPGAAHVSGGLIVNPAKLPTERRDAVCMQCHMEGKVAIEQPGRHVYEYRAGDRLQDYIRYYVLDGSPGDLGAVSQVEALAQSTCKRKSGDAMSCTSCHNPHYAPGREERDAYYRGKCLSCHGSAFGQKHHPEKTNCTACHMPALPSKDVAHTQVTDHRIPRVPESGTQLQHVNSRQAVVTLLPFPPSWETEADSRDLALAWESLAESDANAAASEAEKLLRAAVKRWPKDAVVLSALGYIELQRGAVDQARGLYKDALALDPDLLDAATNLGVIEARGGEVQGALKLWEDAFERAPWRGGIGMNIARVLCQGHDLKRARDYTLRVLEFSPDEPSARFLLRHLDTATPNCGP